MVQPKRFLSSSGHEEGERVKRQNSGDNRPRSRRMCSEEEEYTTDEASEDEDEESAVATTASRKSKPPRRWQPNEDRRLAESVKEHGEANWKAIAAKVGSRNHVQCLQRWKKVLRPGLVKGQWSAEEDAMLMKLASSGYKNWGVLSNHMPGRTSKQCRERWCHHLDPSINKGAYTAEEDKIIIEMQAKIGNKWSQIAARLPGRTENSIKIRCKALQRKGTAGGSRSTTNSPRMGKKSESVSSKERRRQSSSSSTASATSGVSGGDSVVDQQMSEGDEELREDILSSPQTGSQDYPFHLASGHKFQLRTARSAELLFERQHHPPIFSQTAFMGGTPCSNDAASFPVSSNATEGAMGVLASALVPAPPPMIIPHPESGSHKRWLHWPKASVSLDTTMQHSGLPRAWLANSMCEATGGPIKQDLMSQRLPCLGSPMEHHLVDRPSLGASGSGSGGGVCLAPFDGTIMTNAGFPSSSSCVGFDQAPLGHYLTSGINTPITQQETARISTEMACVEQACVSAAPAPGVGMVSIPPQVKMEMTTPPAMAAEKERDVNSFGDFSTLSLEDLNAVVGGDDDDDTAAPLRSCCSFLDLPDEDVIVGDMPLSW